MNDNKQSIVIIGDNDSIIAKQKKILNVLPNTLIKSVSGRQYNGAINHLLFDDGIIIYNLSSNGVAELKSLEEVESKKAAIVVVGEQGNVDLLKNAISAGVSEFIAYDDYESSLIDVIDKIKHQTAIKEKAGKKTVINAIINAKGGGGASFIASNLAYILSEKTDEKVLLVDLDFQFGSVGLNFDVDSRHTIIDALNEIDDVDSVSFSGYVANFKKLGLLLPSTKEVILPGEIEAEKINKLLSIVSKKYDQVIMDLPRIIDPVNSLVMEKADQITIVIQQSLTQFRDGRRLIQILNKDLDIPLSKIAVAINRFDKNSNLKKEDMLNILKHEQVYTITNDFDRVASASNLGIPLFESSPKSKIAQDLMHLANYLSRAEFIKKKGLLTRFMSVFA